MHLSSHLTEHYNCVICQNVVKIVEHVREKPIEHRFKTAFKIERNKRTDSLCVFFVV